VAQHQRRVEACGAQRLVRLGLKIEEFPQSSPNLTAASQNLFELIQSRGIVVYPDAAVRLAVSRAIAVETLCGLRVSKQIQAHKIDEVVALAMACHAAVQGQSEPFFDNSFHWVDGGNSDDKDGVAEWQRARLEAYLRAHGAFGFP
jgi:hypothetical protein